MDLSLNGSALSILRYKNTKIEILEILYIDNAPIKNRNIKLFNIYSAFLQLCFKYKPSTIIKEKEFSRFIKSTKAISEVDGIINLAISIYNPYLELQTIAPTSIKKIITGDGKASKQNVLDSISKYLIKEQQDYKFKTLDCSDATATGIAYLLSKLDN
jgi:crossover junction endodeoxyribonuclease RuvC